MPKEFLVVEFPEDDRRVKANGKEVGVTNTELELERGPYSISLEGGDSTPDSIDVNLKNTSPLTPMIIAFEKI